MGDRELLRNCTRKLNLNDQVVGVHKGNLLLKDTFRTIQGEGPYAGRPALFVRLAGCNLDCWFCDTDYRVDEACEDTVAHEPKRGELVVITGGEPMRQFALTRLVKRLLARFCTVQIETNGTLWPPGMPVAHQRLTIVCSPKTPNVHPVVRKARPYWKYLVQANAERDRADGLPVGLAKPDTDEPSMVFLQPVDEQDGILNVRNAKVAARICMEHGYRLSIQMHKLVGLP